MAVQHRHTDHLPLTQEGEIQKNQRGKLPDTAFGHGFFR